MSRKHRIVRQLSGGLVTPVFWRSGSAVASINEVTRASDPVGAGMGDRLRTDKPPRYVASQPDQLSLANPPWVGAISTGNGFGHCLGRNGEFCVTVGLLAYTNTDLILI